jgi:IS5 family transposase
MEEALHDVPLYREFADLTAQRRGFPTRPPSCGFATAREAQPGRGHAACGQRPAAAQGPDAATGTVVDATLIAAPSSTKNAEGERDPEMRQTKKGNNWYFGMKAHIGVDADSGLVHTVAGHGGQRQRRDAGRCAAARRGRDRLR